MGNATQSQQYVMDTVDAKFEKLRDSVYKLGLSMEQFRSMVEAQALFEWSPEVCLALCTRFCSWVVAEDEGEDSTSARGSFIGKLPGSKRTSSLNPLFAQAE